MCSTTREEMENYPVLQQLPAGPTLNSPQFSVGREIQDMVDRLQNRPMTFVSASQPATGSKQLEAGQSLCPSILCF